MHLCILLKRGKRGSLRRTVKTKVAKPAMATRIGVLMTRVKFTASSSAFTLPVHHTSCRSLAGRYHGRSCVLPRRTCAQSKA